MEHLTPPPFPNSLKGKKKASHFPEIFETLKQVKVNIPFARHGPTGSTLCKVSQILVYSKEGVDY